MQNAVAAVSAFAAENELGAAAIELRTPGDQLFNASRAFLHKRFHRFREAQAVAGDQRILQVQADLIFVAEGRRNTSLRILRVGIRDFFLGKHKNSPSVGEFNGGAQTGDTGANHYELGLGWKTLHNVVTLIGNGITSGCNGELSGH